MDAKPKSTLYRRLFGHRRTCTSIRNAIVDGRYEHARELIGKAFRRFPASETLAILKCRLALLTDNQVVASSAISSLDHSHVKSANDRYELGECYRQLCHYEASIESLRSVKNDGSASVVSRRSACQSLVSVFLRVEQADDALDAAVECVRLGGWHHQHVLMSLSRRCLKNELEKAISQLQSITKAGDPWLDNNRHKMISYFALATHKSELASDHIRLATRSAVAAHHPELTWSDLEEPLVPSVIVIGAMKAGSSSLFQSLVDHPQFVTPQYKELHFFDQSNKTFSFPDEYYFNQFPRIESSEKLITGEASPGYYAFDVTERIKQLLPNVKIIFVRRDPVDRAISHLFHNRNNGIQEHPLSALTMGYDAVRALTEVSEEELRAKLREIASGELPINRFVLMGCYELLLQPWRRTFGDNMMELDFKEFAEHHQATMNRVYEFVELDTHQCRRPEFLNSGSYHRASSELDDVRRKLGEFYQSIGEKV